MIYFISSLQTDKIYFGSTAQTAEQRFSQHKCDYKRWLEGKRRNTTSFEIIQFEDAVLTVLEEVEDKEDMLIGEAFYIRNFPCVNKCIPDRSGKEYDKTYKREHQEQIKKYREEHKEQIKKYREEHKEQQKEYGETYREENKDELKIKKHDYHEKNKDEINARRRAKYLLNRNLVPVMEQTLTVGINE